MLTAERWDHIVDPDGGHPELAPQPGGSACGDSRPRRQAAGAFADEEWFYLRSWGPSRWIKVVVLFEGDKGRILTAFPRRRKP